MLCDRKGPGRAGGVGFARAYGGGVWPTEEQWRASVPSRLARAVGQWGLEPGTPYPGGSVSHVLPVRTRDGVEAVLKLSFPHREARHEAAALAWWDGDGSVRLLAVDPDDPFVLLLERCTPGTTLGDRREQTAAERLTAGASLLVRLWAHGAPAAHDPAHDRSPDHDHDRDRSPDHDPDPDHGFERVADVTAEWADLVEERFRHGAPPLDPGLVRHGAALLRTLPSDADRAVVVHGDANPGNVLAAARERWLVIDPKPMVGDPAYDLGPLLHQVDDPFVAARPEVLVRGRIRLLADVTGLPGERIAAWCTARAVEAALWHVTRGESAAAQDCMRRAAVTDRVAG